MTPYATLVPFFVGFALVLGIAAFTVLAVVGESVVRNRRQRLARHESFGTYYRGVLLSH